MALAVLASTAPRALADITAPPKLGMRVEPRIMTIDEGRTEPFTVTLTRQPIGNVEVRVLLFANARTHLAIGKSHLRFTPEDWERPREVPISALLDADSIDEKTRVVFDVSSDAEGMGRYRASVRINDTYESAVVVTPPDPAVDEGASTQLSVALASRPSGDVEVSVAPDESGRIETDTTRLRFGPTSWKRPQTVTVSAPHDDDAVDDVATLVFTVSGADQDPAESVTTTVHVNDDDEPAVAVTPAVLTVDEGRRGQFSVVLTSRPTGDVLVRISHNPIEYFAVNKDHMTFTPDNWNRPQRLTVNARHDDDAVGDETTFTFTASGADYDGVENVIATARTIDDDWRPTLVVDPGVLTVDEGRTATYTAALSEPPPANVVVDVSLESPGVITLNTSRLEFTPESWDAPQTVTLRVLEDADSLHEEVIVTHLASHGGHRAAEPVTVRVRAMDNDRGLPAQLTGLSRLDADEPRVVVDFCFTALGIPPGHLSDFQIASIHGDEEPNPAQPDSANGVFVYRPVTSWTGHCRGGRGVGMSARFRSNMPHLVRVRARRGSDWVVSELTTVRRFDHSAVLEAQLRSDGYTGVYSNGDPVFPDVPETVHGEFEIAVAFGFRLDESSHTDAVSGLDPGDFVVTNATLRKPAGGFEHERTLGYRLRVTPTTLGEDVTVQVRAGTVTEPYSGRMNQASNVFRRRTAPAPTGPSAVVVSAAGASAQEEPDSVISFPVRLSRPAGAPVQVRYATSDGTARAGEDYVATSGTLTFELGEMERHVAVPILVDARDEGEESFVLTLSEPVGASLGIKSATGTIVNTGPLPREWLTRFGRTVAAQAVDAIGARLSGARGTKVVIAGTSVEPGGHVVVDPNGPGGSQYSSVFEHSDGIRNSIRSRGMTARELALTSEFQLASGDAPAWTAWGRFAAADFEGSPGEIALDGDVTTGFLGFDVARERWLAGVAMSLNRGDGSFRLRETGGVDGVGEVESRLTSLYPYARYRLTERTDVWGMVGYGTGDLAVTERAGGKRLRDVVTRTGIDMRMGALGARSGILSSETPLGLEVALRTDAFWVRTQSDAVDSAHSGRMAAATGDASRVRLLLEGSRMFEIGDAGTTFTPLAEVGIRRDGGDAETGTGLVAGAGARFASRRFAMEFAVRSLVAHEESGHEAWGASGSIRIDPGAFGRGLSLSVTPAWGAPAFGAQRLGSQHDPARLQDVREATSEKRLAAELGYGLAAPAGRGVLTPYAGATWTDDRRLSYRLGARWDLDRRATLGLEGTRQEPGDGDGSDNVLSLRATVRW